MSQKSAINFTNPPLQEVVCGIVFEEFEELRIGHFGLLWGHYAENFPKTTDKIPIFSEQEKATLYPRVWFLSADERRIIQIQRNRLLFNWQRVEKGDQYPRFDTVYKEFSGHLNILERFLSPIRALQPTAYELVYVNHIEMNDIVLPDLLWRKKESRYLSQPQTILSATEFKLPFFNAMLQIKAQSAQIEGMDEAIQLTLTVRGREELENREQWFEEANKAIVHSFVEITDTNIQKEQWGRY